MAKLVSLAALRTDAYARADLPPSGSGPVDQEEANGYVNKARTKYYDELIQADAYYNVGQQVITTASPSDPAAVIGANGQQILDTYKLPPDFYETKGLDINLGGQQMQTGRRVNWHDRNLYKFWGTTGWFFGQWILYYLRDGFMIYVPIPQGPFSVTHWYYPVATTLSADTDTVDVLNGGDDYIALYAAMQMARKEENFELYNALRSDFAEEVTRVKAMAPKRDAAEPARVAETSRRRGYWPSRAGRL